MLHDGASPNGDDDFALHLLGRFQVAGAHEFEPPKQTDLLGLEEL